MSYPTYSQEAENANLDEEQQSAIEGNGLVYLCNGKPRVRKQGHVNLFMNPQDENKFGTFSVDAWAYNSDGYVHIGKANIDIEIPEGLDVLTECLKALNKEKEKVKAELQEKLMKIDGMIQNLLALPAPTSDTPPVMPTTYARPADVDDDIPF